jgi:predicted transcriptional regulator
MSDTEAADDGINIDRLVKIHAKIKAKIEELDSQIATLEEQRTEVRTAIKDLMRAQNLQTVRTTSGLVSLVTATRYNTADWDSFKQFIIEHQMPDLLEKRIAQTNMATFLEENPGVLPPGLNAITSYEIRVTKARK